MPSSIFSAMECFTEDRTKKPRKRQMSREKRILANRHERERVRKMNDAYEELRSTIPNYEETRVKTKLELLRIATNYIQSLKYHLQTVIRDGYSPEYPLMYPPAYDMEGNEAGKLDLRESEYLYPPHFPPSQLPLRHFAPHQTVCSGSQFPPPMTSSPDSSSQDFFSVFTSSPSDPNSEESFLYNLQVTTRVRGMVEFIHL